MKKILFNRLSIRLSLLVLLMVLLIVGCQEKDEESARLTVAVSIAPQESFVKAIAGDLVDVVTLIPSGASPTNYQPSPKEMSQFQKADIYFTIGVPTEIANILPNMANNNNDIKLVYLDDLVAKVYPARYFSEETHEDSDEETHEDSDEETHEETLDEDHDHDHQGRDPHIWLSPKRVILMVQSIRDELILVDDSNEDLYRTNADNFISELQELDQRLTKSMSVLENRIFVIMHPSLGYFADDYNLTMIAIEQDGKESSAAHLQEVIDFSKENQIKVIFYQTEFDSSQARTLAQEINGQVLAVDVLSSNYMDNMNEIARIFEEVLN